MSEVAIGSDRAAPRALRGLRVLIAHEWLYAWAGAERCLEQMFEIFPDADLLVGVRSHAMRDFNPITRRAHETWVGRLPGARSRHRWFLPLHALAFAGVDTSGYDLVISSSHAFEKFIHWRRGPVSVCYCYSPPRFLWGMQAAYAARAGRLERAALTMGSAPWRLLDRRAASRVGRFMSISKYIADRVRHSYGVESDVVYPPVTPKCESPTNPYAGQPYLLTLGRMVEYKRIDLLIAAAERLQVRLVVAGDGPERRRLERAARRYAEFVGETDEATAGALLRDCAAFMFAGEEDFGIAPVEANAHGRPVVCYGRGGALETMKDGETATFFHEQTVDAVAEATQRCLARSWDADRLRANAARFAPVRFREGFVASITRAIGA